MRSRLRRALHELLEKDQISLESGIVNELFYRIVGVEVPPSGEDRSLPGFNLERSHWNNTESVDFSVPRVKRPQTRKILAFFNISEDDEVTNAPLALTEDMVFETFLKAFVKYYEELKQNNPAEIAAYRVKSMPILESSAVNTLRERLNKAIEVVLDKVTADSFSTVAKYYDTLRALLGKLDDLRTTPVLYKSITQARKEIDFLKSMNTNVALHKSLCSIEEGIELFTRYNRTSSVLANKAFMEEVENLLVKEYDVSACQCNVIESAVMQAAGVSLGNRGEAKVEIGHDESRLVFHFVDMTTDNAQKLVNFFRAKGDETANKGRGYRHYGSAVAESAGLKSLSLASARYVHEEEVDTRERHSIEIDGQFAYDVLFPQIKEEFKKLPAADMAAFKQSSVKYLENKRAKEAAEAKPAANPSVMFGLTGFINDNNSAQLASLLKK